jgi:hypothetical protein
MYGGIFNKGDHIPIILSCKSILDVPTAPDAVPTVAVFDTAFGAPTVYNLNTLDRYGPTAGLFVYNIRPATAGQFTAVLRYTISGVAYRHAFRYIVRDVGNSIGVVRSISELRKSFEDGIGYQTEDGTVTFGRGPY